MTDPDIVNLFDTAAQEDQRPDLAVRINRRIEGAARRREVLIAGALWGGAAVASALATLVLSGASVTLVAAVAFLIAVGAVATARVAQA